MMAYELLDNGIGKILILDKGKNLYMKIDIVEVIKISYPDSYKDEMYDIISIKGDLCDFESFQWKNRGVTIKAFDDIVYIFDTEFVII